ncbi:MAG: CopG family ribbon-helix-helix protein [Candidatus Nitrosopumilus limneticus]|nr:CopG family ribbon-helix-helix protein [Candidatus Nitrosopumilus limneticus]MDC4212294.1 CopG family ribbon-helix-helix protein [Candidatus Nitrosopumilus limneticus]MDC4213927.1 CopG family ribbon-helix-helix protein [Candidatus Nitrosopumilus limneticus]MDC4216078.1 CopG family ribbon-helix-helix protein [Candidatus Nitrosopumilus limneticus]MDC4217491.1 CopG family ribbon-helix-helix protein [Candidatus Nitrosopumilus limneticus]
MPIVSISLNNEILKELDKLQISMGFSGRSEIIRAGIRSFVQDEKQKQDMTGKRKAFLMVVHADEFDDQVAGIKHDYEDLIKTHLHSKVDESRCVELFLLDGDARKIESVTKGFVTNKKMDTVKLMTI